MQQLSRFFNQKLRLTCSAQSDRLRLVLTPVLILMLTNLVSAQPRVLQTLAESSISRLPSPALTDNHCGRCHSIVSVFSHPIDVIPSMIVPENLPLQQGRITCITCHDNRSAAHADARANHTPLLRVAFENATGLCRQCHNATEYSRDAQHGTGINRAHLAWPQKSSGGQSPAGFDPETKTCLSCHDGLVSSDAPVVTIGQRGGMPDHPLGASMIATFRARPNPDANLRSPQTLDHRIRLFDGKIGCGSCHSPDSSEPKLLVMSNRNSQLCLSCHVE